jgi:hypothetical protein
LDLEKSSLFPGYEGYFYRAVILADMGNKQDAASDCAAALTFADLSPNVAAINYITVLRRQFCMSLTTQGAASFDLAGSAPGSPVVSASPNTTLRSEVEEVEKSGRFMALPAPQVTRTQITGVSSGVALDATRVVRNGTSYQLRVVFTGPVDREITLEPGVSQTIILKPGQYKVLGRVSAPNVTPFLGPQTYNSGETYTSQFVIR